MTTSDATQAEAGAVPDQSPRIWSWVRSSSRIAGGMLTLTEEQEQRAARLHREAFVFDFLVYAEPFFLTDRQRRAMEAAMDRTTRLGEMMRAMADERLRELDEDPSAVAAARDVWAQSGVDAVQVTLGATELDLDTWDGVLRDIGRCYARQHAGYMQVCTDATQLEKARSEGKIGLVLGVQNSVSIGRDLNRLDTLHSFGLRVMQLTYNTRNYVGDGCTEREQSGLSRFGVDVVRRMNEVGILVDVSHCGYRTTIDAIEVSESPIAFTHVSCAALVPHARAKTDEQIKLLAASDGYLGVVAVPFFLKEGGGATIEDMMSHVKHAVEIMGPERVGIATDWGFWTTDFPPELREAALAAFTERGFRPEDGFQMGVSLGEFVEWGDWPQITRGLVWAGFTDDEIRGFLGRNWLRFLARVQKKGAT